jgi:hypothetical protein
MEKLDSQSLCKPWNTDCGGRLNSAAIGRKGVCAERQSSNAGPRRPLAILAARRHPLITARGRATGF